MSGTLSSGISRRSFIGGALATGAALAAVAGMTAPASVSTGHADEAESAVSGGIFKFYLTNPDWIDPYNVQEDQGSTVCRCLFDPLCEYDYDVEEIVGKMAESWEANEDASQFTFHLRDGVKFHNGDPVTSESFRYAWNRLCSPFTDPSNPSEVSYHISMVDGYDEVVAGLDGAELNLECPDDLTFVVNLSASYADFPFICSHLATSPVPESAASDMDTYKMAPVGNGAFKMEGSWVDGQYIQVVRNEDYWGDPANIDGIGINASIETSEWAAYLTKLADLDYQIGRYGWIADYPIMDNFLYPLFYTGNGDNRCAYSNPEVDAAMDAARATVDDAERIAALQDVDRQIGADLPVIPLMFYRHTMLLSNRVNNFYADPMKNFDFVHCWLS